MDKSSTAANGSADSPSSTPALFPTLSRESTSSTATITPRTDLWPRLVSQASSHSPSSSAAPSPLASRDPSPARPLSRTSVSRASSTTPAPGTSSRKNSITDRSPSRAGRPANPTLSSTIRTLSSSTTPALPPAASEPATGAPVKSPTTQEHLRESPRWPVSPRLRSPPPILNKPNIPPLSLPRRADQDAPSINLHRATPPQPETASDTDNDDAFLPSGVRTPARGVSSSTLETVQEVSPLGSPRALEESMEEKLRESFVSETSQSDAADNSFIKSLVGKGNMTNESGSETGSIKTGRRSGPSTNVPSLATRQSSSSKPSTTKGKAGEGSLQSMTVETETVASIPQVALAAGGGTQNTTGTLRQKPSTETIRPKKDKRKASRKPAPVTAGTASSKADIFEAKVASAVEEANSSDSEETFVYDSNPPDKRDRPHRFHSRTPSATSMVSQVDRNGMRSIHTVMESSAAPHVAVKKSMKFVNSFNPNANETVPEDDGKGTIRSNVGAGSARGTARHHHHFGRWGRNSGGNGHPSLFTEPSPFVSAAGHNSSRQSSGPPSPRFNTRGPANGKRTQRYEFDDPTSTPDEDTPLLPAGTIRSTRSGRTRRGNNPLRNLESQSYRTQPSVLNRFASCLVLTVMLLLVVTGAIGFMFATSQPLTDIRLVSMHHVVASQQELMLDLTIEAHNPNVVVVVVDSADIEVFAKSKHAGTDSEWWRLHPDGPFPDMEGGSLARVLDDSPEDPMQPPDDSAPNMRLGTISSFDSALSFEGSFFHSGTSNSTGEVRLKSPGNGTVGGNERWEHILKDEFQLILKGVLRYTLPLSQRVRTATILGKTTIKPNAADDPLPQPNTTLPDGGVSISL
ncbi:vacuolar segregation protein 7 [Podospora conica]|nr:vacuolar segregation protein 7 [Schizothecium conicum]